MALLGPLIGASMVYSMAVVAVPCVNFVDVGKSDAVKS